MDCVQRAAGSGRAATGACPPFANSVPGSARLIARSPAGAAARAKQEASSGNQADRPRARAAAVRRPRVPIFGEPVARANGDPGGIRTPDLRIRNPPLYPAELRGHRPNIARRPGGGQCRGEICAASRSGSPAGSPSRRRPPFAASRFQGANLGKLPVLPSPPRRDIAEPRAAPNRRRTGSRKKRGAARMFPEKDNRERAVDFFSP